MHTNSTIPQRKVVKVAEAARMLSISTASVRRLIDRKLLRASCGMRHFLIRVEEIERYLRDTEI